ncbi:MAG: sulfatase-like hydrolase/transferase [Candidatus Moduliflexus flocculans]|nr:sulfatase-like hydrolase/transferase [Candidatus Moduliflexus flocculans]MCK7481500.1 sulfatase-like hydrolase/transferase [Candidatus Moduliflexus flocculans]
MPYDPPSPYKEEFGGRPYDGEIAYMDRFVGAVLDRLEEKGVAGRTLVVVAGDHGEGLGDKVETGHGIFLYEETVRVPFIVRNPGAFPAPGSSGAPFGSSTWPRPSWRRSAWPAKPAPCRAGTSPLDAGQGGRRPRRPRRDLLPAGEFRLVGARRPGLGPLEIHPGAPARALRPRPRSRRAPGPGRVVVRHGRRNGPEARAGARPSEHAGRRRRTGGRQRRGPGASPVPGVCELRPGQRRVGLRRSQGQDRAAPEHPAGPDPRSPGGIRGGRAGLPRGRPGDPGFPGELRQPGSRPGQAERVRPGHRDLEGRRRPDPRFRRSPGPPGAHLSRRREAARSLSRPWRKSWSSIPKASTR